MPHTSAQASAPNISQLYGLTDFVNSSELTWSEARQEDRFALQSFTCTSPKPSGVRYREPHPSLWELDVQNYVRNLKPPVGDEVHLGWCEETRQIAVVIWWRSSDVRGAYDLIAIAVAMSFRGRGCGDLAMRYALAHMEGAATASGMQEISVLAFRDHRNEASEKLLVRHGFRKADPDERPEPWVWVKSLDPSNSKVREEV